MTLVINTNVSSLIAQQSLGQTQDKLAQTLNRLSTGLRINSAKDDAAGLAIAQGMLEEINGLRQGARNGNDGVSLIQTAESGMDEVLGLLQRMRELASQASTGTYQTSDLANLDTEFQSLKAEVDRVSAIDDFNGIFVLQGGTVGIQIGNTSTTNDQLTVTLLNTSTTTLAIGGNDLLTNADAQTALGALETAISTVTTGLATLGAADMKIEEAVNGNIDRVTKLEAARSQIMDADFADESSKLAQYQILQQAGAAMLSQANSSAQIVLKLLQ